MTAPMDADERAGLRAMIAQPHLYREKHIARLAEKALDDLERAEAALARVTRWTEAQYGTEWAQAGRDVLRLTLPPADH